MKAPALFDDGSVIVKGSFIIVFEGIEKLVRTGVAGFTKSDIVIVQCV